MRKLTALAALLSLTALTGCDQMFARNFGGTVHVKPLPAEAQLINMTWKGDSLWVLYYLPSTKQCIFQEDSSLDTLEGKAIIDNCKPAELAAQAKK